MARKSKVNRGFWYWGQRGFWVASVPGSDRRIPLLDDNGNRIRDETQVKLAEHHYWRMLHEGAFASHSPPAPDTVDAVCQSYINSLSNVKSRCNVAKALKSFQARYGKSPASAITKGQVVEWLDNPNWGASTRVANRGYLRAAFNAADILPNPATNIKLPKATSRQFVFSPEQEQAVVEHSHPAFAFYFHTLMRTGARPDEIAKLTPAHITVKGDRVWATLQPHEWKNGLKTGKRRIILFQNGLADEVARLASNRPADAPLIANTRGQHWTGDAAGQHLAKVKSAGQLPSEACLYSARHTYITRAMAGTDIPIHRLAELCGTSTKQIEAHYGHLRTDDLWQDVDKIEQAG